MMAAGNFGKDGFDLRIGAGIDGLGFKSGAAGDFNLACIEFGAWISGVHMMPGPNRTGRTNEGKIGCYNLTTGLAKK